MSPSDVALAAFGRERGSLRRLSGGRGHTCQAGAVVLRPAGDEEEARWRSDVLATLRHTAEFRTPRPVRAGAGQHAGQWVVDGWEAWEWMPGVADETRVLDVVRAGDAFHRAVAALPRPSFVDTSEDPWSRADRMAWQESPLPPDDTLARLAVARRPVRSPAQIVHGDLLGNVLFAEGEPPTIIDWAPYWRPAGLGAAIAAADAVCWHGVPLDQLAVLGQGVPEWGQLLVRALIFRIATLSLCGTWDAAAARHAPVVDAVVHLCDAREVTDGPIRRVERVPPGPAPVDDGPRMSGGGGTLGA